MKRENLVAAGGPPRHVSSLDGIRALCCIGVIGHHFGFPMCQSGWVGVEMFFVLSGFLITTLLCREYRQTGRLSLPNFWARRAFRLLPIYWLYAAFLTVAVLCSGSRNFKPSGAWTLAMYVTSIWAYFVNFAPNGLWSHQLWTAHLWSLAKEEQFYFCWPVLLVLFGRWINWAWIVPLGVAVAGMLAAFAGKWSTLVGYTPLGITAGCAVGMIFSLAQESAAARIIATRTARWMLVMICLVLLLVLQLRTARLGDDVVREWGMHVIVPLYVFPFALLVASMWYGEPAILDRCLGWKPLAYLGTISYGIYLYHMVLISPVKAAAIMLESHTGIHLRFAFVSLAFFALVVGIASASYFLIERPMLRIGKKFRPRVQRDQTIAQSSAPAENAYRSSLPEPLDVDVEDAILVS